MLRVIDGIGNGFRVRVRDRVSFRAKDGQTDRQTDGWTDGRTDKAGCRVAQHSTEQGRIHSYRSRMRVGRGNYEKSIWASQ